MVDILETIQEKYVPFITVQSETGEKLVSADTIFFGGDQLTEERARNVQRARADGQDQKERLEAVFPKNEDWHAIRTAYKV
jgi:cyanate lyase